MLDSFWQPRLEQSLYLETGKDKKEIMLFDKMQINQPLNLIENLLIDDETFIKKFNKVFVKNQRLDKTTLMRTAKSLITCSPEMELAVTYFVFRYITDALKQSEIEFLNDENFKETLISIEKEFDAGNQK